jgi:hypothetical protein
MVVEWAARSGWEARLGAISPSEPLLGRISEARGSRGETAVGVSASPLYLCSE